MVDLSAPLKSRAITSNEGKKHWLNFEYRRLPHFRYSCGKMDTTQML